MMKALRSLTMTAVLALGSLSLFACTAEEVVDDQSAALRANCTLTIGYWKTHAEAWPVTSLSLGSVNYSQAQLLAIFNQPVAGNGLISLAHQLIGAKLNVANGADAGGINAAIAAADALIGSRVVPPVGNGSLKPSATSSLVAQLDGYNTGATGPGHCGDTPPPPACGNGILESGETCDDGNLANGDGCSSTCCVEPPPPPPPACGNGILESGETCDDGNLANGDGCSSTCCVEPPPPPPPACGNEILEAGEQCDDGNLIDGDGCSSTCCVEPPPPPPPVCGNGILEAGETCDDGNLVNGDGCCDACLLE
jgi:cysteine-rich repeat protein